MMNSKIKEGLMFMSLGATLFSGGMWQYRFNEASKIRDKCPALVLKQDLESTLRHQEKYNLSNDIIQQLREEVKVLDSREDVQEAYIMSKEQVEKGKTQLYIAMLGALSFIALSYSKSKDNKPGVKGDH